MASESLPWHADPENAAETFPNWPTTTVKKGIYHKYKDIYHSTPNYNRWRVLPSDVCLRVWVPNGRLAVERLSLFFQAWIGPPYLEERAATAFLQTLTWPNQPENEQLGAVAVALDNILPSNGGHAGTLTVARTQSNFDFEREPHNDVVYLRFEKDRAETSVEIPRYADGGRVKARDATLDHSLLRTARRIQTAATEPPTEVALAMESYRGGDGELSIGVTIRDEPTIDDIYRERHGEVPTDAD